MTFYQLNSIKKRKYIVNRSGDEFLKFLSFGRDIDDKDNEYANISGLLSDMANLITSAY